MTLRTVSIISAVAAAALGVSAQVNSPAADGYLQRARLMLSTRIFQGAFDQASHAASMPMTGTQDEDQLFLEAMSALRTGQPSAQELLTQFANTYPQSQRMPLVETGLGDCFLNQGNYPAAMAHYRAASLGAMGGTDRDDLAFRMAYCDIMAGNYADAQLLLTELTTSAEYGNAAKFYTAYIQYAQGNYDEALRLFKKVDQTGDPGRAVPYYEAQILYRQEKYAATADICRPLLRQPRVDAFTPETRRLLGESLWNGAGTDASMRAEAVQQLLTYVNSTPSPEPSALYILGIDAYDAGRYAEALSLLQRVTVENSPLTQSAYLYMGQCYSRTGNRNAALMAYEHAYRLDYSRAVAETAYYNYAVTTIDGGKAPFASSVGVLEGFLSKYPDSKYAPEVETFLINGYLSENNYEAALAAIDRIQRPSPAIEGARQRVLFMLGTHEYANGRYTDALAHFGRAASITQAAGGNKDIATQCLIWEGDCQYALARYNDAAASYLAFLKNAPKTDPNRPLALYDLGYTRFAQQRYGDALTDFRRYVATGNLAPANEADAYCRMGDCSYYSNAYAEAAADYRQAYELNPQSGDYALYQLAMMKGLMREHRVKISTIDEMIRAFPGSPLVAAAMMEKADSYAALSSHDEAAAVYREVIQRYPSTAQGRRALLQLAITHEARGARADAKTTYRKLISSYPTSEEAAMALDDLKQIYADEGNLAELTRFLSSVTNAPAIDRSEFDDLAFDAAEKAYTRNNATDRLSGYLADYPNGSHRAQALCYMAEAEARNGRHEQAIQYAQEIVDRHPDAEAAEEALLIKARSETATGRSRKAFDTYKTLASRASTPQTKHDALLGMLRQGVAVGEWASVAEAAESLRATTSAGSTDRSEIGWSHGKALEALKRYDEAERQWSAVTASGASDEFASRSAVDLATMQLDRKQLKKARKTADAFINSNPPQPYWLARGFIVLSDILRSQGETFEADEYLRSLRNNYPGKEEDIFQMIDERLNH